MSKPIWTAATFSILALFGAACGQAAGSASTASVSASAFLGVGQTAPQFSLPSAEGGTVALSSFSGHRPVLLYFSMGPG